LELLSTSLLNGCLRISPSSPLITFDYSLLCIGNIGKNSADMIVDFSKVDYEEVKENQIFS
jgi:hypothetical protein